MEARQRKMKYLMRMLKMLKRLLKKLCQDKKIDKHVYDDLFMKVKDKVYKNKRVLMESMHKYNSREIKFARSEKRLAKVSKKIKRSCFIKSFVWAFIIVSYVKFDCLYFGHLIGA